MLLSFLGVGRRRRTGWVEKRGTAKLCGVLDRPSRSVATKVRARPLLVPIKALVHRQTGGCRSMACVSLPPYIAGMLGRSPGCPTEVGFHRSTCDAGPQRVCGRVPPWQASPRSSWRSASPGRAGPTSARDASEHARPDKARCAPCRRRSG